MAYTDSIVRPPPPFPQASPALLAPSQQAECEESESTSQAGDQVGELLLVGNGSTPADACANGDADVPSKDVYRREAED
jgi:hypothetical protein